MTGGDGTLAVQASSELSHYMDQRIIGFHLDEEGDWVADLDCGHGQHVRHNPPWVNRPWVQSEKGRRDYLNSLLRCKKCDEQPHDDTKG